MWWREIHPCLAPNLKGKALRLLPSSVTLFMDFLDALHQVERDLFCTSFLSFSGMDVGLLLHVFPSYIF